MRKRTRLRGAGILGTAVAVTALGGQPGWASVPVAVTVSATTPVSTIAPGAVAVNAPLWNPRLLDPAVPALIRLAGIGTMEFNSGGVSDLYHWQDGSLSPDPDPAGHPYDYFNLKPTYSFDQFMGVARAAGAATLVHVNYGTGTPAEAAGWVRYANRTKHYGIRDWAIGEEVWGNGWIPGVNFEPDGHADRSPTGYATNVVAFAQAMKAVDPTIRIGAELSGIPFGPFQEWDQTVISVAGPYLDFVDFHVFPFGVDNPTDAELLALPRQLPGTVAALRALVARYGPPDHPIDLVVGETNSAIVPGPQQASGINGLFAADNELSLLETGVASAAWWALHNGGFPQTLGDLGLLSTGDCDGAGQNCAPPASTPFPAYYGFGIAGAVARPGGQALATGSADPAVIVHAVKERDGSLALVLLNEDPATAKPVSVTLSGFRPRSGVTVLTYSASGNGNGSGIQVGFETGTGLSRTLAPYTITVLLLQPR